MCYTQFLWKFINFFFAQQNSNNHPYAQDGLELVKFRQIYKEDLCYDEGINIFFEYLKTNILW